MAIKYDVFIEEYKQKMLIREREWKIKYVVLADKLEFAYRNNVNMEEIEILREKLQEAWTEFINYSKMVHLFIYDKEDKINKWCEQFDKNSTSITFDIKQFKNK